LPFLVKGEIEITIFGWVPKSLPIRKLRLSAGQASALVEMSDVPKEHHLKLRVVQPVDSIALEIPPMYFAEEGRSLGAVIGYIKVMVK
jgi:hypothetical protein